MNIREVILTSEAVKYKDFAKRELWALENQRVSAGQVAKRKVFKVGSIFILIYTSRVTKKIIMWGGDRPLIVLTNYLTASGYDYYSDALSDAVIAEGAPTTFPVKPLFNGRSQLGDATHLTFDNAWSSENIGNNYEFLGGLNSYEMGVFNNGSQIYGRVGGAVGNIAIVPDTFLPNFSKSYGSLFGLPAYKNSTAWNKFRGAILYTLNGANQALLDSWYWTPSFFTVQPSDAYGLKPGYYYGRYPASEYDGENALVSAKVSLKAVLDTRHTSGLYQYGWAEVVREINGVTVGDLCLYFQDSTLSVPPNSYDTNISVAGTTADQFITVGSDIPGFNKSAKMSLSGWVTEPDVEMWNFQIFEEGSQNSGVCIALIAGTIAKFYRFSGYTATVYETLTYHSHSTRRDGRELAIFESTDGIIIDSVQVFDLHGTREAKEGSAYTSGGFTQLRASGSVASVEALTGCIIPYREEGFEPSVIGYDLATAIPTLFTDDYTDYLPSLSTIAFAKTGTGSPTIKKVVCSNGIDASFGVSVDDCFASVIVIADPYITPETDKLVGAWGMGGVIRGKVRGEFTGSHPSMRFNGVGSGESVTLPDTFTVGEFLGGGLYLEGYVGDLTIGSCIVEDGIGGYGIDPSCAPDCDGNITISASSSCGQTASNIINIGITALTLSMSGGFDIVVGDFAVGGGGTGVYTYSFDSGTIDSSTGKILSIGSCGASGTSRAGTVTVDDGCTTADIEVRLPGGSWVQTSSHAITDYYNGTAYTDVPGKVNTNDVMSLCSCTTADGITYDIFFNLFDAWWGNQIGWGDVRFIVSGATRRRETGGLKKFSMDVSSGIMAPSPTTITWAIGENKMPADLCHGPCTGTGNCYQSAPQRCAKVPLLIQLYIDAWRCP